VDHTDPIVATAGTAFVLFFLGLFVFLVWTFWPL
jgi:uncharacterized membrane protein YtjA (UPF0391 family)